jgi:hypothetical protein
MEQLTALRNELYDMLPTGEVTAWDMVTAVKKMFARFDEYIDAQPPSAPAVDEELRNLRQWKESAITLLNKIDEYACKHPDIKLGQSKVKFVIDQARKYDELAASTTQGAVWVNCTKRMPEFDISSDHPREYIVRLHNDGGRGSCIVDQCTGAEMRTIIKNYDYAEWLDETGSQRQAGPGWVNCQDRMPEIDSSSDDPLKYILEFKIDGGRGMTDVDYVTAEEMRESVKLYDYCRWLDESQSTPSKEVDAVELLIWMIENGYIVTEEGEIWQKPNNALFTPEKLIELYQQNK